MKCETCEAIAKHGYCQKHEDLFVDELKSTTKKLVDNKKKHNDYIEKVEPVIEAAKRLERLYHLDTEYFEDRPGTLGYVTSSIIEALKKLAGGVKMSEHEHKILRTISGGFYCAYVGCDLELLTAEGFMALLNRTKALEGVVEAAQRVIDLAVSLRDEDGCCPLCTEGKTGCVVLEMERYISRLEEVQGE